MTDRAPQSARQQLPIRESSERDQEFERALKRDLRLRRRRDTSHHTFWRWLGVLGMVGWPLTIGTVGGAWLGHYLDERLGTGIRLTMMLLTLGLGIGSLVVWNVLKGTDT